MTSLAERLLARRSAARAPAPAPLARHWTSAPPLDESDGRGTASWRYGLTRPQGGALTAWDVARAVHARVADLHAWEDGVKSAQIGAAVYAYLRDRIRARCQDLTIAECLAAMPHVPRREILAARERTADLLTPDLLLPARQDEPAAATQRAPRRFAGRRGQ